MYPKFLPGDVVTVVKGSSYINVYVVEGKHYCVDRRSHSGVIELVGVDYCLNAEHFELAALDNNVQQDISRPILEERKVGKVKMQLFDEGFPNAIMEIAKMMTWAEQCKGYKPNDWKGLPNAETEFSAATSRHRVKGFIQKAEGVAAIDRTDEESSIVHLAHTCFNCLAELELVLTGKIK
jgi:hypothetical protein